MDIGFICDTEDDDAWIEEQRRDVIDSLTLREALRALWMAVTRPLRSKV